MRSLTSTSEPPLAGEAQPDADPYQVAREIGLRALDRRAYGRAELGEYLTRRGADREVITRLLDRFTEVGLLDDEAYANQWVESRHRARSKRALSMELRRKGLDAQVIDEAVGQLDGNDESAAAHELARRRAEALVKQPYEVALRRVVSALGRRGFASELAWAAAKQALAKTHPASRDD